MIGKLLKSGGFKGAVNYVLQKEKGKLLYVEGLLWDSNKSIVDTFKVQAQMNPNIKKPAGHISLSYSKEDSNKLTDNAMITLAKEYLVEMELDNTQYIIVRHTDTGHPHVHIVYNRIDNNGKVLNDSFEKYRNIKTCKKLKEKYGLYFGKGKSKVNKNKLKGKDKVKYQIHRILTESLKTSKSWQELKDDLLQENIEVEYKYKGQTKEIQGICFKLGKVRIKASDVDRKFSYLKLNERLQQNKSGISSNQNQSQNINKNQINISKGRSL